MATNLVSQIVEALGPTIVGRIASSLGFDQSSTQKAINAAVPGLLAALISLVSKPQGASKLADVVAKQPPGLLSSLADAIGGAGQKAFVDKGSSTLSSLLGGTTVSRSRQRSRALRRHRRGRFKELARPSRTGGLGRPGTRAA